MEHPNNKNNKSSALAALTAGALAMPAFQTNAATAPTESEVAYRYSYYKEDNAPEDLVATGDLQRYTIDTQQLRLLSPLGKSFSLSFTALAEKMSGASPLGTQADTNGDPQLVMSGASGTGITEDRTDFTANVTHYGKSMTTSLTAGQSDEKDYESSYYGLSNEWEFNNKSSAIQLALSHSDDTITPTDAILYGRIQNATKDTTGISLGFSQAINKANIIQLGLELSEDKGYLAAPYKINDVRPDSRSRTAAVMRYRGFYPKSNSAIHFDYRYYWDDWEVTSHTFDLAWYKNATSRVQLIPSFRYYSQTEASFYEPYKVASNTNPYYSSDYRLSPYGAVAVGLQLVHKFKSWSYTAKFERYESDSKYSLSKVAVENPGLVSFTLITVGFDIKF